MGVLLALLGLACTPFADRTGGRDAGPDGPAAGGASELGPSIATDPVSTAAVSAPCDMEGEQTCADGLVGAPLRCVGQSWMRALPCRLDERCETRVGAQHGACVPIEALCLGRGSGTEVCDGDALRVCIDYVLTDTRGCGRQQRCAMVDGEASCVCVQGLVDEGQGCRPTTSCRTANGGCDPLTMCSSTGGARSCSDCPDGYAGSGLSGCLPSLLGLSVEGGTLTPPFDPDVHEYRVRLPLLCKQAEITATAPTGTSLEINGAPAPNGAAWSSPELELGEQRVQLQLSTQFGSNTSYTLALARENEQETYFKASRPDAEDHFGWAVAISGDTLVVGSLYEDSAAGGVDGNQADNGVSDSGAAYVFVRRDGRWQQEAYLKAEKPVEDEFFGVNVAISGDTIAVGACHSSPWGNTTPHAGSVYVFERSGGRWSQSARLTGSPGDSQDMFGWGLALQGDVLAVGAPYDSTGVTLGGAVFVFERANGQWSTGKRLEAKEPAQDAMLGFSVALDADTLVAGAMEDSQLDPSTGGPGSAYVFVRQGDDWLEQEQLRAPQPTDGASFGFSVAVRGDTLAIGAPYANLVRSTPAGEAHVFERQGGSWSSVASFQALVPGRSDGFGGSVALGDDTLIVGAPGDSTVLRDGMPEDSPTRTGAVYVMGKQTGRWAHSVFIQASNARAEDQFGWDVALDGDTFGVGADTEQSSGMGVDGDQTSANLAASGAVYVFR